jgi:hypothetical protein
MGCFFLNIPPPFSWGWILTIYSTNMADDNFTMLNCKIYPGRYRYKGNRYVVINCMIFFHDKLSSFNVNGLLYNTNKTWWNLTRHILVSVFSIRFFFNDKILTNILKYEIASLFAFCIWFFVGVDDDLPIYPVSTCICVNLKIFEFTFKTLLHTHTHRPDMDPVSGKRSRIFKKKKRDNNVYLSCNSVLNVNSNIYAPRNLILFYT